MWSHRVSAVNVRWVLWYVTCICVSLVPCNSSILSACLDARPFDASGYMRYVDGQGWQSGALRSANYCPHCQQYALSSLPSRRGFATRRLQDDGRPLAPVSQTSHSATAGSSATPSGPSISWSGASSTAPSRKICGHDHCNLSIPTCCACADRRPHMASYPLYIDGRGITSSGTRWSMYCSPCHDFHDPPPPPRGTYEDGTVRSIVPDLSETQRRMLTRAFGGTMAEIAANPDYISPLEEMFPATVPTNARANEIVIHDTIQPTNPTSEIDSSVRSTSLLSRPTPADADGEGNRVQTDADLCKICFAAPSDAVLLPCAHLVSCAPCAVLILTHNMPSPSPGHDEIDGRDLIRRAERLLPEQTGQLRYAALRGITRTGPVWQREQSSRDAACPICRDPVRRWIKVYRS